MSSSLVRDVARRVRICWCVCFVVLVVLCIANLAASPGFGRGLEWLAEDLAFSCMWYALFAAIVALPAGLLLEAVSPTSGKDLARRVEDPTDA